MKVLIVNRYMGIYGGAETVVRELAVNLSALGVKCLVITLNISDEVRQRCGAIDIVTPEKQNAYRFRSTGLVSSMGIIREMLALRRMVKRYAPGFDLINVHNFPANWVVQGLRKPVVWMCNEIPDFYNNPKLSLAMRLLRSAGIVADRFMVNRFIDTICVADEFNAQKVFQRYGVSAKIINYGIEYGFFSHSGASREVLRKYNLEGNFFLLQVGMFSPEKNQLKSVMALDDLKAEIPDMKLVLAGRPQDPYESMVKDYVAKKGLEKRVIFTGHIQKDEIRTLYQACGIALFPVRTQGGWLSPFEALSSGKPVVTSSTMGASSIIKKENIGVVSDDLVSAVKEIHNNYAFYQAMAERGRQWVKESLTWELFSSKMLKVFEEAVSVGRRL